MIFGKYINRYYLRSAPVLLLGLLALLTVDYIQLMIPELYRLVINGVNLGEVVIDGQTLAFTKEVLFQHICLPMIWIVLLMVVGRFLWRVCFFGSAVLVTADLRELTGNTTHESANNAADKPTDSRTDLLQQLAALTDQPGKAGDLCKGTDSSKNDRQLSDKSAHAEHTYHSAGDQCSYRTQRDHNAGQQTDAGDGFHQYACIKSCQSINDAGEECRDHIDCRLNEFGQPLCNAVQQVDQEQHNRVNDFRSIVCKRSEHAGQQC